MFILIMNARAQGTIEYLVIIGIVVFSFLLFGCTSVPSNDSNSLVGLSSKDCNSVLSWGVLSASSGSVSGCFDSLNLTTVDSDLNPSNVRSGVDIFGVVGSFVCSDGVSGDSCPSIVCVDSNKTCVSVDNNLSDFDLNDFILSDSDFKANNIRKGVNLFGISGSYSCGGGGSCPTCESCPVLDGNALDENVLAGYSYYNSSSTKRTGSMPVQSLSSSSVGGLSGFYDAFDLNVVDSDLNSDNIRLDQNLFGVIGTFVGTYDGNAVAGVVREGYSFYGNSNTLTAGTLATQSLSSSSVGGLAGFYDAFDLNVVDTDLNSDNIRSGVSLFGISGNSNVVNTSSGDAVAGDILFGKLAWVDGSELTGSMVNVGAQVITPSTSNTAITAGYHDGSGYCAGDANLVAGNIKSGTAIFGVNGTLSTPPKYAAYGTGQTSCYDGANLRSCPVDGYPGQDAEAYGSAYRHVWQSGTNTVLDLNSGLRWQKGDNGSNLHWWFALEYCDSLSLDGYNDWRLPNKKEILDMYNDQTGTCQAEFSVCATYWSSTTVNNPQTAYVLESSTNGTLLEAPKSGPWYRARCVRFEN
jgi:hypothetical protein